MKKLIFLILGFLTVTACFGQTTEKYEPFESFDYASDKYQIKLDSATFSKFKIEIRQAKLLDNTSNTPSDFYCRGWLTIRQGDKIINQQYFKSIEPVGGCYGLFIPETQPRKDFFIFSKLGDYDGSIFILDTTGKLTEKLGGSFFISKDKRYLFSNYDSDIAGLTVYDLNKRLFLYSESESVPNYLGTWYFQNGKYFARAYDNNSDDDGQKIKIASFDFKTNKLVISKIDKTFLKDEIQLKVYNDLQYDKECNCGL